MNAEFAKLPTRPSRTSDNLARLRLLEAGVFWRVDPREGGEVPGRFSVRASFLAVEEDQEPIVIESEEVFSKRSSAEQEVSELMAWERLRSFRLGRGVR